MDRSELAKKVRRLGRKLSGAEIASRLSLAESTVYRWLSGGGAVSGRPSRHPPEKAAEARKMRAAGRPVREISDDLGVPIRTVYRWSAGVSPAESTT